MQLSPRTPLSARHDFLEIFAYPSNKRLRTGTESLKPCIPKTFQRNGRQLQRFCKPQTNYQQVLLFYHASCLKFIFQRNFKYALPYRTVIFIFQSIFWVNIPFDTIVWNCSSRCSFFYILNIYTRKHKINNHMAYI